MFCILKKITRKSLNEKTMLSKGLQKSEGMSHGEAGGIASLAEGTASTKTFRGKCAQPCLRNNKGANTAAAKSARKKTVGDEVREVENGGNTGKKKPDDDQIILRGLPFMPLKLVSETGCHWIILREVVT